MRSHSEHQRKAGQRHRKRNNRRQPLVKLGHDDDDHDEEHHEGLEPKLTRDEVKKHRSVIFTSPDGREYQSELPGSWSNARVAAEAVEKVCHDCRDSPHFDTEGHGTNRELARRIGETFSELKAGKGFLMAWRIYPDKDHPRWDVANGCGCGCSCSASAPDETNSSAKAAKRKDAKAAKKRNGR
jgi:hypothetical protein